MLLRSIASAIITRSARCCVKWKAALRLSIPESGAACTQPGEGCQDVLCFHSFDALKCKFFNR